MQVNANTVAPSEAAAYLGIAENTLAIWRCTKRYPLAYIKVGRRVRYRISDLEAFLATRTISADSMQQKTSGSMA